MRRRRWLFRDCVYMCVYVMYVCECKWCASLSVLIPLRELSYNSTVVPRHHGFIISLHFHMSHCNWMTPFPQSGREGRVDDDEVFFTSFISSRSHCNSRPHRSFSQRNNAINIFRNMQHHTNLSSMRLREGWDHQTKSKLGMDVSRGQRIEPFFDYISRRLFRNFGVRQNTANFLLLT